MGKRPVRPIPRGEPSGSFCIQYPIRGVPDPTCFDGGMACGRPRDSPVRRYRACLGTTQPAGGVGRGVREGIRFRFVGELFRLSGRMLRRRARAAPRHQPDADEVSVTLSETPTHRPARRQRRTCVAGARAAVYRPVRSSLVALRGIYSALLLASTRCATHLASNLASGPADLPSGGSGHLASGSAYGPLCFARRATCSPSGRHTICHDSSP